MNMDSTSQAFFEAKYQESADPWSFASSPAELFRYDCTIHSLVNRRYRKAFEPACSVGVLTKRLSYICDEVLAFDVSQTAVTRAKERCAGLSNVEFRCGSVNDLVPDSKVDLIILSEVGYYFSSNEWSLLLKRLLRGVDPGCTVLAVHWLGSSEDHYISGDEVHRLLLCNNLLMLEHEERHEQFRLDRLVRA